MVSRPPHERLVDDVLVNRQPTHMARCYREEIL
jgi:hypothetical protein